MLKPLRLVYQVAVGCVLMLLAACSGLKLEKDDAANLQNAAYRDYAWAAAPIAAMAKHSKEQIVDSEMRNLTNRILASKAYVEVPAKSAGMLLRYSYFPSMVADEGGVVSPSDELDRARHVGQPTKPEAFYNHQIPPVLTYDNLLIEFITPASGTVIWHGKASLVREYGEPSGTELTGIVTKMATKILSGVPSQP